MRFIHITKRLQSKKLRVEWWSYQWKL